MTRNSQEGGQYGYGGNPSYGNPSSGESSGYNYQQLPGQGYGGYSNQGAAQSYYGSNDQQPQQYPPGQQHNPYQGGSQQQQPPPYPDQQQYGGQPPQQQSYGTGYGQDYTPPPQHFMQQQSSEVDTFRSHFDQPNAPPNASSHYGDPTPPGAEGDRGVMGALAGGAAGAWGGHKVNHGIVGGLGGAVAGSMLENAYKKHNNNNNNKKDKEHGGNFRASAHDVHIEGRSMLVAECRDAHGHKQRSALDLNDCLTNNGGRFEWLRGGNFAASAQHVRLSHDENVLEAELGDGRGGWQHREINLNERIGSDNGRLYFTG